MSGYLALAAEPLERLGPRTNMFIAVALQCNGISSPAKVRNMSALGAMLDMPSPPRTGEQVFLRRGSLNASGEVAWSIDQRCGIRFASAVQVSEWMARPTAPKQACVDEIMAQLRGGVVPSARQESTPVAVESPEAPTQSRLKEVSKLLEELEEALSADPAVIAQHGSTLQNLDIALQLIKSIQIGSPQYC